uniref:XPA_C domain-containing protein n=1 Tax=Parastrongyloides trichosuri TaxID=131310 RepID=A0A0N5A4W0_PARTI
MNKRSDISDVEKYYLKRQKNYKGAGGFDVSENDELESREKYKRYKRRKVADESQRINSSTVPPDNCDRCKRELIESYLWLSYGEAICDRCREENEGDYKYITKTDAKQIYLLKDADLELRKPSLRYVLKKNPRNPKYGDMALYLEKQVEERAYLVHGGIDGLEEARRIAEEKSNKRMINKVKKEMANIRKDLRDKESFIKDYNTLRHDCSYGDEIELPNEEYQKICVKCGSIKKYTKM